MDQSFRVPLIDHWVVPYICLFSLSSEVIINIMLLSSVLVTFLMDHWFCWVNQSQHDFDVVWDVLVPIERITAWFSFLILIHWYFFQWCGQHLLMYSKHVKWELSASGLTAFYVHTCIYSMCSYMHQAGFIVCPPTASVNLWAPVKLSSSSFVLLQTSVLIYDCGSGLKNNECKCSFCVGSGAYINQ